MPDRPLPTVSNPQDARAAFLRHRDVALDGYEWKEQSPLSILVSIEAARSDGGVDPYLARFSFQHYPAWPPSVTFLNPDTEQYDPKYWPQSSAPDIAFHAPYGDAPEGMVCNSMFFEYYFWGGHSPDARVHWDRQKHTFAASLNELRIALGRPYYQGRV